MAKGRKTGGRQKGTPNKINAEAKSIALEFLNRRTSAELDALWKEAKAESPSKALAMWFGGIEFVMPKLARQEITGGDGGPVEFVIRDMAKEKA
jgi:hypothetical protein